MITLKELLASRSVRELNALARAHALPFSNQKPRSDVVARLYEDFSSQGCFQRALKRLRSEERTAIDVFVRYGGCLKSVDFFQRFGDIRPYHPWRTKTMPWKHPISIAESLWVKGFIQPRRGGVHLCADLIPFLTTTSPKPLSQAYSPFGTPDAERRRVGGEGVQRYPSNPGSDTSTSFTPPFTRSACLNVPIVFGGILIAAPSRSWLIVRICRRG